MTQDERRFPLKPDSKKTSKGYHVKRIKDMYFGATDANNEFIDVESDLFRSFFCLYPGFSLNEILSGRRYLIHGSKGSGKTMLLRYTELEARERSCQTRFIKYKRQISNTEKQQMAQALLVRKNSSDEFVTEQRPQKKGLVQNHVLGWELYLIKTIVYMALDCGTSPFFEDTDEWVELVKLINALYGTSSRSAVQKLLPKVDRGQVTLGPEFAKLDIVFGDGLIEKGVRAPFSSLAEHVISLYQELVSKNDALPMYLFIDEVELTYGKKKEYERDVKFIGDMIESVYTLNDIAKENGFPVRIILALREEVIRSVSNVGRELNKAIEDRGIKIDWRQDSNEEDNPLLTVLERRITSNLDQNDPRKEDVWKAFFPQSINEIPIKKYILDQTWSNPRDIVRLLNLLQASSGDSVKFTQRSILSIRKEYAERSWSEIIEEISATKSSEYIEGLQRVLYGIKIPFTLPDFIKKINIEAELYKSVECVKKETKPAETLELLFRYGIIGNVPNPNTNRGRSRVISYGETEPEMDGYFSVHYPLRTKFDSLR